MAIILNLPPDLEAALRADAQAQGKAPEVLAAAHLAAIYAARDRAQSPELLWTRTEEHGSRSYFDDLGDADDEGPLGRE